MRWVVGSLFIFLVSAPMIVGAGTRGDEAWQAWKQAQAAADQGRLFKEADHFYTSSFLEEIGWPGARVHNWLLWPLMAIDDVHARLESGDGQERCLLLNGYTENGEARSVSIRFVHDP